MYILCVLLVGLINPFVLVCRSGDRGCYGMCKWVVMHIDLVIVVVMVCFFGCVSGFERDGS